MKLTLIENALDFILSAIKYAKVDEARSLKYAVLHLSDGVELILKEKLRREHWSLLFADVNKASESALTAGEFKSVDFDECIERLEGISGLDMTSHTSLLKLLRRHRNRLQHFEYKGSKDEVMSILVKTWGFVLDFLHDQLPDIVSGQAATIDEIKDLMIENEGFVRERLASVQKAIDNFKVNSDAILKCPQCLQPTLLIPGGHNPNCLFCRYSASPEEAVEDWCVQFFGMQSPKERAMNPDRFTCPECGQHTLIQQEFADANPPDPGWVCFNCGKAWDYDGIRFCDWCNEPYGCAEDDLGMCADCERMQLERD
jgi:hypothetical protein